MCWSPIAVPGTCWWLLTGQWQLRVAHGRRSNRVDTYLYESHRISVKVIAKLYCINTFLLHVLHNRILSWLYDLCDWDMFMTYHIVMLFANIAFMMRVYSMEWLVYVTTAAVQPCMELQLAARNFVIQLLWQGRSIDESGSWQHISRSHIKPVWMFECPVHPSPHRSLCIPELVAGWLKFVSFVWGTLRMSDVLPTLMKCQVFVSKKFTRLPQVHGLMINDLQFDAHKTELCKPSYSWSKHALVLLIWPESKVHFSTRVMTGSCKLADAWASWFLLMPWTLNCSHFSSWMFMSLMNTCSYHCSTSEFRRKLFASCLGPFCF